jgi:hypothetical protein
MFKILENYLQEISNYLSGRKEREEILSEIRSHILEKANEGGPVTEASLEKVIAAFGTPRHVAEKFLDDQPVIAPVFRRHLFRYTSVLFAIHLALTIFAVAFRSSFAIFPFFYMPKLGFIDAVMYLPMAFMADFGFAAMLLYLVTRSNREVRLPWPKLALDLDQVNPRTVGMTVGNLLGGGIVLAIAWLLIQLQRAHGTFFLLRLDSGEYRPLLQHGPGRWLSLFIIALFVAGAVERFVRAFARSRRLRCWITAAGDSIALILIAAMVSVRHPGMFTVHVPAKLHSWLYKSLTWVLLVTATIIAVDLVSNLVRLNRKRLTK